NKLRNIRILTDPVQTNALITIRSTQHAIRNIVVADNDVIECGGSKSGEAEIVGIRVVGPRALSGIIGPNRIDNGSIGSIDVGLRIDASVPKDNGLVINGHVISPNVPTRYRFETPPSTNRTQPSR